VTSDVIVGFPGETEAQFAESLAFVESLDLARLHVFPYSLREGTPAAQMPAQVSPQIKAERAQAMRAVAASSARAFRQRFIGRTMEVLWETSRLKDEAPVWSGLTDNYLRVHACSIAELGNTISPARLVALTRGGLRGTIET